LAASFVIAPRSSGFFWRFTKILNRINVASTFLLASVHLGHPAARSDMGISMLRIGAILLASATLAGCAHEQPPMVWLRLDGQRGAGNLVLTQQFETDQTICLGKTRQGNERSQVVDAVAKDCMAEKGYIQVPEDQAEVKSQELTAIQPTPQHR
jgi:hypothetical protein